MEFYKLQQFLTHYIYSSFVYDQNMLKFPINQAGQLLSKAALGVQAAHRIYDFMERERIIDSQGHNESGKNDDSDFVLKVEDGTFFLGAPDQSQISSSSSNEACEPSFTLSGITIQVKRGEVLAIVGPVASGKSTLIQGLLGDVQCSDGTHIFKAKECAAAYAAQTPFILSTTVRENILFGSSFDKERYEKVLDACCLRPDLLQWPAGGEFCVCVVFLFLLYSCFDRRFFVKTTRSYRNWGTRSDNEWRAKAKGQCRKSSVF